MAVTAQASGSQTATINVEHTLAAVAVAGVFSLHVDTVNMAAGDLLELRLYQIILAGGTARVAFYQQYIDAQSADDLIKLSPPIGNELTDANSLKFTLKQVLGTGRVFPWKVLSYT